MTLFLTTIDEKKTIFTAISFFNHSFMSYEFVHTAFKLALFLWFPLATGIFIYLLTRVLKKMKPKLDKLKTVAVNHIASLTFIMSIPAFIIYIILLLPLFYFNHQTKQYDYCSQVIVVNKMTDPNHEMLQERCSQFDLNELIQRSSKNKP